MRQLLVSLLFAALLAACGDKPVADEPVRAVRTMTVGSAAATATHEYAAEIRARTESRLGFRVAGKLISRSVDLGQAVRAGEVLARLDAQDLQLGEAAADAAVKAAQVNVELAAADLERYKGLRDQGFISAAELERRDSAWRSARAQLDSARAQWNVQRNQTGYAVLKSDSPGVITGVDAEPGMVLASGAAVVRLAHDGPRDAVFSVPEDRVAALRQLLGKAGALGLRLWGQAGDPTPATLREISAAADPATRTFLVKADIGRIDVRLGQTATVSIAAVPIAVAPNQPQMPQLPLAAVTQVQGQTSVWLLDRQAMTVQPHAIVVAGADANSVVVAAGLVAGQTVVTAGVHALTPGQKVRLYIEPAASAASR
jgi:RND family efflux transporter MFP subunit